jgi:hypothetical protein
MTKEVVAQLASLVMFIVGIGAFAGGVLAIVKLWKEFIPNPLDKISDKIGAQIEAMRKDVNSMSGRVKDMEDDLGRRVGLLEIEIARIDQPAMSRRFDNLESKIDRLHDVVLERLTHLS